jgi:hypothetical protein
MTFRDRENDVLPALLRALLALFSLARAKQEVF